MGLDDIEQELTAEEEAALRGDVPPPKEEPKEEVDAAPEETAEATEEETEEDQVSDPPEEQVRKLNLALKEERDRVKKLREEYDRDREVINERLSRLQEAQQPKDPEPEPPSYDENPIERLKWNEEQQRRQQEEIRAQQQQIQLAQALGQADQAGRAEFGDYDAAVEHVMTALTEKWTDAGFPERQARAAAAQEMKGTAVAALQARGAPHKVVYNLAKRMGYAGKANGTPPNPTKADEKLKTLKAAASQDRQLHPGAPQRPKGKLSVDDLLNLPDEEFDKITDGRDNWERVVTSIK